MGEAFDAVVAVVIVALLVGYAIFWISALADLLRSTLTRSAKAVWLAVLVVFPVAGPVAWTWVSLRHAPQGWATQP
jgi:hypothetical protein